VFDLGPRLLLAPLLIAQALQVRRRALKLPEAAGERQGVTGTGPELRLRIIGDSSAAGVGTDRQDTALSGQTVLHLARRFRVDWALDAVTGATTRSTLARLATARPEPADVVITALGVNDVTRLVRPATWIGAQERLHDRIQALYDPRRIYVCGMPPMEHFDLLPDPLRWTLARQGRAFEALLAAYCAGRSGITHVPFSADPSPALMAEDGFHPSAQLYAIWGKEMASRIATDWPFENPEPDPAQLRAKASL
jgi:lysophospholipase L1-like esterase